MQIAQKNGCRHAVKSKSIYFRRDPSTPPWRKLGIEVTETDFGEYILQVAGETVLRIWLPLGGASHAQKVSRVLSNHLKSLCPACWL